MSETLHYSDLSSAEQLRYQELLRNYINAFQRASKLLEGAEGDALIRKADAAEKRTQGIKISSAIAWWGMSKVAYYYGKIWWILKTYEKSSSRFKAFLRGQAQTRGVHSVERRSFPHFPHGIDPFTD